jgi:hypothetical protein
MNILPVFLVSIGRLCEHIVEWKGFRIREEIESNQGFPEIGRIPTLINFQPTRYQPVPKGSHHLTSDRSKTGSACKA